MLLLNEQEMRAAVTCEDIMEAVEKAFLLFEKGDCKMADRYTASDKGNTMLYMPCFVDGVIGTKMLAEFPGNPAKGYPYLSGLMVLNNAENGQPEAIMNGSVITALRTGAVGGVAMKHFSDPDTHSVGLVGCGVQGVHQLMYACSVRDITHIYLYDVPEKDLKPFISKLKEMIAPKTPEIIICKDTTELLKNSQAVITATQAREPLFPNDPALLEGKCFIGIGSWQPVMREYPEAIWDVVDCVYTELPFACEESGDLSQPLDSGALTMDRVRYMGNYLTRKYAGEEIALGKTRFYKSVGMGIFDAMAAKKIMECAKKKSLGKEISL